MLKLGTALLAGILLVSAVAGTASAELPRVGDHMKSIPGQPICSNVDELVQYLRVKIGRDEAPPQFKSCGPMPTGIDYTIVQVTSDDPDVPIRPARIEITGPQGASITGWTVVIDDQ